MENWSAYKNKTTCLAGEVNSGKTRRLAGIIQAARDAGENDLALLDLAPDRFKGVGGKLEGGEISGLRILTAPIHAPRLMGKDQAHTLELARENAATIQGLIDDLLASPCACLFVNDVSLYLQAGDPRRLYQLIEACTTVVINGYFGKRLGEDEFSQRERQAMEELFKRCDLVEYL